MPLLVHLPWFLSLRLVRRMNPWQSWFLHQPNERYKSAIKIKVKYTGALSTIILILAYKIRLTGLEFPQGSKNQSMHRFSPVQLQDSNQSWSLKTNWEMHWFKWGESTDSHKNLWKNLKTFDKFLLLDCCNLRTCASYNLSTILKCTILAQLLFVCEGKTKWCEEQAPKTLIFEQHTLYNVMLST